MASRPRGAQQPPQAQQQALQQPTPFALGGPKDLLLSAIPPLKAAIRVLRAPDPIKAAGDENDSWFGIFVALAFIMIIAMMVLLAADGAPFVDPWSSIWRDKFAFFVVPSYNWPVLLRSAAYVICACTIGYLGTLAAGLDLSGRARATRKQAIRLAGYAGLGAVAAYAATLLLLTALGWILFALKLHIFVFQWMTIAAVVVLPLTTWAIVRIFRRTSLPGNKSVLSPLTISMTAITTCALGAIFIMDGLTEAFVEHGRTVNSVRNTPTAAVVQTCAKTSSDVVCAVTLFPAKWQDYELIGDWKLGNDLKASGMQAGRFRWHPAKDAERQFPMITLESRKDITVEIRIAADLVCTGAGTHITKDDQFFAVQGRVLGEQRTAPQEMRLLIGNAAPGFAEMMKQVCTSPVSA
jgi:hypothetical protein